MADKIREGDAIEMLASIGGDNFAYSPNQVLFAGQDIPVELAQAYVSQPADDPRARLITPERAALLLGSGPEHEAMRAETPPGREEVPPEPDPVGDRSSGEGLNNGSPPPPASTPETPELLVPVFAALYASESPVLDPEQKAAAEALLEKDPGNELAKELRAAIERSGEEEEVGEKRDTNPSPERQTAPGAETRETATQKRRGQKPKPPEPEPEKK
jgi:hypothetical protein